MAIYNLPIYAAKGAMMARSVQRASCLQALAKSDEIGVAHASGSVGGGVGGGADGTLCIYTAAVHSEAVAVEPFSPARPPAVLPRKTIGRLGDEGWPAVVEVRSIGQMMNDESENIRLTDHRGSFSDTRCDEGFKLVHRRPPKI